MIRTKNGFIIDPEIESYIMENKKDFRVCTTCGGPVIVPTELKPAKPSDIKIEIGDNVLYVSKIQVRYLRRFDKFMLEQYRNSPLCSIG